MDRHWQITYTNVYRREKKKKKSRQSSQNIPPKRFLSIQKRKEQKGSWCVSSSSPPLFLKLYVHGCEQTSCKSLLGWKEKMVEYPPRTLLLFKAQKQKSYYLDYLFIYCLTSANSLQVCCRSFKKFYAYKWIAQCCFVCPTKETSRI